MYKTLVSFITILTLLISVALPNSHAMMMDDIMVETSNDHCAEMMMKQNNAAKTKQVTLYECCDDCQCLMASCSYLFADLFINHSVLTLLADSSIGNKPISYSDPTHSFFIPPKIS